MPVAIIWNSKSNRILNPLGSDYTNIQLAHFQVCLRCTPGISLETVIWKEADAFTVSYKMFSIHGESISGSLIFKACKRKFYKILVYTFF